MLPGAAAPEGCLVCAAGGFPCWLMPASPGGPVWPAVPSLVGKPRAGHPAPPLAGCVTVGKVETSLSLNLLFWKWDMSRFGQKGGTRLSLRLPACDMGTSQGLGRWLNFSEPQFIHLPTRRLRVSPQGLAHWVFSRCKLTSLHHPVPLE